MKASIFSPFLLATLLLTGKSYADAAPQEQVSSTNGAAINTTEESTEMRVEQIAVLSEAFGHMLAQHIQSLGIHFDVAQLIKGLEDAHQGKSSPMDEMKCIEALTQARQQAFQRLAKKNLQDGEQFIAQTAQKDGVQALEEGKLYYHIERNGEGATVAKGNMPLIRYKGSFIDGTVFGSSKEDDLVSLDETIPGFGRGLLGMKEGEKRTLYIHPDLGYGTSGQLPPNSVLVFEIELLKAHATEGNADSISSSSSTVTQDKEISQNEASAVPAPDGESSKTIR